MNWKEAELEFQNVLSDCFNMGSTQVTDLNMQYADIDIQDRRGVTYSVKLQRTAEKYGCFLFETKLMKRHTQDYMDGCFTSCKADNYVLFRTHKGRDWCWVCPTMAIKELINQGSYRKQYNTLETSSNVNRNRKYDMGELTVVPCQDIYQLPQC